MKNSLLQLPKTNNNCLTLTDDCKLPIFKLTVRAPSSTIKESVVGLKMDINPSIGLNSSTMEDENVIIIKDSKDYIIKFRVQFIKQYDPNYSPHNIHVKDHKIKEEEKPEKTSENKAWNWTDVVKPIGVATLAAASFRPKPRGTPPNTTPNTFQQYINHNLYTPGESDTRRETNTTTQYLPSGSTVQRTDQDAELMDTSEGTNSNTTNTNELNTNSTTPVTTTEIDTVPPSQNQTQVEASPSNSTDVDTTIIQPNSTNVTEVHGALATNSSNKISFINTVLPANDNLVEQSQVAPPETNQAQIFSTESNNVGLQIFSNSESESKQEDQEYYNTYIKPIIDLIPHTNFQALTKFVESLPSLDEIQTVVLGSVILISASAIATKILTVLGREVNNVATQTLQAALTNRIANAAHTLTRNTVLTNNKIINHLNSNIYLDQENPYFKDLIKNLIHNLFTKDVEIVQNRNIRRENNNQEHDDYHLTNLFNPPQPPPGPDNGGIGALVVQNNQPPPQGGSGPVADTNQMAIVVVAQNLVRNERTNGIIRNGALKTVFKTLGFGLASYLAKQAIGTVYDLGIQGAINLVTELFDEIKKGVINIGDSNSESTKQLMVPNTFQNITVETVNPENIMGVGQETGVVADQSKMGISNVITGLVGGVAGTVFADQVGGKSVTSLAKVITGAVGAAISNAFKKAPPAEHKELETKIDVDHLIKQNTINTLGEHLNYFHSILSKNNYKKISERDQENFERYINLYGLKGPLYNNIQNAAISTYNLLKAELLHTINGANVYVDTNIEDLKYSSKNLSPKELVKEKEYADAILQWSLFTPSDNDDYQKNKGLVSLKKYSFDTSGNLHEQSEENILNFKTPEEALNKIKTLYNSYKYNR